ALIAITRHQVGAAQGGPATRFEAGLFGELSPRRGRDLLARFVQGARRNLPELAASDIAKLSNQDDATVRLARDDANRARVPDDLARGEVPVGQPDLVAIHLEEFAAVDFLTFDRFLHTGIIMAA